MDALKYLELLLEEGERIRIKQGQVQKLHESLTSLSAPTDKEQVSHTKNVSVMADTIAQIVDMEREIDQQTQHLYKKQQEARRYLDCLKPRDMEILIDRFIQGKKIEVLMREHHFCRSTVYKRIADAIQQLQEVFDEMETKSDGFGRIWTDTDEYGHFRTLTRLG